VTDRSAWRRLGIESMSRLVTVGCVVAMLVALAVHYPDAFRDANRTARANASLDLLDREIGGGNSVIPDQGLLVHARGLIPENETFTVAVGPKQEGWTELTEGFAESYAKYFLLPRRAAVDAPWILCLACARAAYPAAEEVWSGEDGLAILRLRK
jgi:hypothetical protein